MPSTKGTPIAGDTLRGNSEISTNQESRVRAVAMQHALSIEERKNLKSKVLDMIIVAFDLPSGNSADPAHPATEDSTTFRECLALFRPSDLDELVTERNLDGRCGYAMCKKANRKQLTAKKWDDSRGRFVDKVSDGRWCSDECKERNGFAREQLSTEPVWLRQHALSHIRLLSDQVPVQETRDPKAESRGDTQLQSLLALERGEPEANVMQDISIREKEVTRAPKPPRYTPEITVNDLLEGLPIQSIGRRHNNAE